MTASRRRRATFATLLIGAAVLAGCTTPGAGTSRAGDPPPAAVTGGYDATDVCAYLKTELPALTEIGSPVGRHANLAGKLAGFFESHGKPENGAVLDAATEAKCPAVRTEVLTLIGVDSFREF